MLRKLCGRGLCGRIAGLLLISGFVVALVFDGLLAIAGGGVIMAGGVLMALSLEDSVAPSPALELSTRTSPEDPPVSRGSAAHPAA
jgi:hypothetical protein